MKCSIALVLTFAAISLTAQKKVLDHTDLQLWNTISGDKISNHGAYVVYALEKGEKDRFLKVKDTAGITLFEHDRAQDGIFTYDSKYVLFTIKAWTDSVTALKSRKVKKEDLPKDTLAILDINTRALTKIGHVKSYKLPEEWSGYIAYELEDVSKKGSVKEEDRKGKDTIPKNDEKKNKPKKVGKKTGYHVVVRNLANQKEDTLKYVTDFAFAKKGQWFAYATSGAAKDSSAAVFAKNLQTGQSLRIHSARHAKYRQLSFSDTGKQLGFIVDPDSTKTQVRPNELFMWQQGNPRAQKLLDSSTSPKGYLISADGKINFSKDGTKLYFGLRTPPVIKDTTLTEDEIVNVEVWTYDEPRLYTVQELQLKNDTVRSYPAVYHLGSKKTVPLATTTYPLVELGDEGNAEIVLVSTPEPYQLESQWTGRDYQDYALIDTRTGEQTMAIKRVENLLLSPKAKFVFGYSAADSTWVVYDSRSKSKIDLTKGKPFFDEQNDSPDFPASYGLAGFTKDDASLVLYDRYDLWEFDPKSGVAQRLTNGRETNVRYRYLKVDNEERSLDPKKTWLLSSFDEYSKASGYASYAPSEKKLTQLVSGSYRFSEPKKAKLGETLLFTQESFQEFPNLRVALPNFKKTTVLSDANPQQKDYNWGTIELVGFTSLDGKALKGLLVKPEDFDPSKKYPMIVNFYERSADDLHIHRLPKPERSSINYSFYASRGYVVFNPDVEYRIGYPGESAYNCVMPGVSFLMEKGFIDPKNIGIQGHSWGGYQIAYLVTKTNLFKAAEAGAPVPNMISAYGGIRWWTGFSRQFQYEHTQSRIGGTPWEYPQRYVENSPIFNIDKIQTPLLIMHNDADGHVPWYQGIEFFVSLRRLGKPAWFLNYNGEPHWPVKLQNRIDFNMRMAQFFDHFLKNAPKPVWMDKGVPAIEKGIHQGLELPLPDTNP